MNTTIPQNTKRPEVSKTLRRLKIEFLGIVINAQTSIPALVIRVKDMDAATKLVLDEPPFKPMDINGNHLLVQDASDELSYHELVGAAAFAFSKAIDGKSGSPVTMYLGCS